MSESVLTGNDDRLTEQGAALARYAVLLTAQPWSVTPDLVDHLGAAAVEAATAIVAVFNYLTRVADASGIEFDYASPLPAFQPERGRRPVDRPDHQAWPVVPAGMRDLPSLPATDLVWRQWREYVFDSPEPLSLRERLLLARAAAQECCDRERADELRDSPQDGRESALDAFARKLSCRPWQMNPGDLQTLRDAGYSEPALLHAISVVALQNAESRLALGRGLTAR